MYCDDDDMEAVFFSVLAIGFLVAETASTTEQEENEIGSEESRSNILIYINNILLKRRDH